MLDQKELSDRLNALVARKRYVKIFYQSDLKEILQTAGIVQRIETVHGRPSATTNTGLSIRVDRLISLDNCLAPGWEDYEPLLYCNCDQ